jgi:hypothetical protein
MRSEAPQESRMIRQPSSGKTSILSSGNNWSHWFALVLLLASVGAAAGATAQEGLASGRATDADMVSLTTDLIAISRAQARENAANSAALQKTRQQQLLGEQTNSTEKLMNDTMAWWMANILNPLMDVARNPASSCDISQKILAQVLGMEAQAQKFGLSDPKFGSIGDPESVLRKALGLVKQRCMEEAYDECVRTGNGMALTSLAMGFGRQLQLLGMVDSKFEEQVAYLFRRCTVYKVKFHSENHLKAHYTLDSVFDGSVNMLFEFGEGSDFASRIGNGKWKGPTSAEAAAPDVMVTALNCQPASFYTCESAGALTTGPPKAEGIVKFKRHATVTVLGPDNKPQTKQIDEGTDDVNIDFTMPLATAPAKYYNRGAVVFQTRMEVGGTAFSVIFCNAKNQTTNLTNWIRQGHPTLFNKQIDGSKPVKNITYSDQAKFELIHRPDLYPPDQINPEFELTFNHEDKSPPRKPLKAPSN